MTSVVTLGKALEEIHGAQLPATAKRHLSGRALQIALGRWGGPDAEPDPSVGDSERIFLQDLFEDLLGIIGDHLETSSRIPVPQALAFLRASGRKGHSLASRRRHAQR